MPDTDRYITVADCAQKLACDPSSILSLIRSGALRASDISLPGSSKRRWRISVADLETFLAARQHTARQRQRRRPRRPADEPSYY